VDTTVVEVTLAAFATALATGLGALPFLFVSSMSRRWVVPDARRELGPRSLIPWLVASFVAMSLLQLALLTR
jgi:hypothetical protein